MTAAILMLAGTAIICGVVYLIRMGCKSIVRLCDELNRDQRNGYRIPPKWLEGDK